MQPLLFQPGDSWEYGIGVDWSGIALQRVLKTRLNDYIQQNICQQLGLYNVNMIPTSAMKKQLAYMHSRKPDSKLVAHDHPLHRPLVAQLDEETHACFNSGGAGIFARPQEYIREMFSTPTKIRYIVDAP
ncbi:acyltransferase mlcH [Colletotrichum spaethianum]|uniref:Acyltransferase mlcH n=2 Tax=Colletotrichum spaethianum species complex TaxID=2707349 RepID=A0AA37UTI5_9PEZI|nr:acyltransferase mlcH [Colletotrichum spaethianum]XP_049134358.1 acyltransferase mlcH [Colletotrichum spaethianum]GJC91168.1 acyltransferase mlcH [Colletotrichum liriopes]GKT51685.1 acyltransferase mlcH [Colletotrichum spaethianum]GKT52008.1 acyltransferase mlcH [Colletotrichum spaethianum]